MITTTPRVTVVMLWVPHVSDASMPVRLLRRDGFRLVQLRLLHTVKCPESNNDGRRGVYILQMPLVWHNIGPLELRDSNVHVHVRSLSSTG